MDERATVTFCGLRMELETGGAKFLRDDSLWRLRAVHERFLATQTLAETGRAIDIGAGFGAFALPFARRYPGWEVWCFEPDPTAFAALQRNILAHGLTNLRAFPVAVRGGTDVTPAPGTVDKITRALLAADTGALLGLCAAQPYRRHLRLDGFLDASPRSDSETEVVALPTLPADVLTALKPDLVKLIAPWAERGILAALQGAMPRWLVGESWQTLSPRLLGQANRAAWVPFARAPHLALRRSGLPDPRRDGLDILLHADQAPAARTLATLVQLTATEAADVRFLLVATPRTDLPALPEDPRLHVLRAPHTGWSTAQNLGRSRSEARHIAFVDVQDQPEPGLFTRLLDLARVSGAEVVQGGSALGPSWATLPRDAVFRLDGQNGGMVAASRLIAAHPPSRARVYRRDGLDARKVWFPEHLAAFAGHYLHFLTLQHAATVPVLPNSGFRESRAIAQPPEAAFYLLEVCRLILKRGIEEGWRTFGPMLDGFALALRETCPQIIPSLQGRFLDGMAELLVLMEKALGPQMPRAAEDAMPEIARLADAIGRQRARLADMPDGAIWALFDGPALQPPLVAQYGLWPNEPT